MNIDDLAIKSANTQRGGLVPPAPRMDLKTADFQRFFFCENQILPLLLPLSFIFI